MSKLRQSGPPLAFKPYIYLVPLALFLLALFTASFWAAVLVFAGLAFGWQGGVWMSMRGHFRDPEGWHKFEARRFGQKPN